MKAFFLFENVSPDGIDEEGVIWNIPENVEARNLSRWATSTYLQAPGREYIVSTKLKVVVHIREGFLSGKPGE